ncbi:MAG TPA: DHHA1 domain-containing protein [Candidatus Paceibacterota bacterium]|nr:DHHA1 domain-containing protein [Verrucomicrobiota bacterium]HSA12703.1 DHHA1 domain-containing protein [Candidatus Paceibacterota bacterium]
MKFRWSLASPQPRLAAQLADALRIPPLLAQCLLNRGLTEPNAGAAFLQPRLRQLADPFLLPQMGAAVERLLQARLRNEPLVIFGDYDVDGVTSTALLMEVLGALGCQVRYYLPHRMEEGYGLSQEAVDKCLAQSPTSLLLAVDCGSTASSVIAALRQRGVDVIVLDHHQVGSPTPAAVALVNPQLALPSPSADTRQTPPINPCGSIETCGSFTELCSVGLAFKLAHALLKRARETGLPGASALDLRPLLDLVALGTIADVVPLTGENRILASVGLERLNTTQRPGLAALKKVAQSPARLGTYEVGFQLAPRLNAAGRLETAEEALRLLLARDLAEALPIAQSLDTCNHDRQKIERGIADQVIAAVRTRFNPQTDFAIVEGDPSWHIGVVGIVAARVLQQFYRPTIILGGDGTDLRGSGRSIPGFDLAAALRECAGLLHRQGGHAMAAGLSLPFANLDTFRARFNQIARRTLKPEELQPPLRLDAEIAFAELDLECLAAIDRLRPIGQGNPPVQLLARGLNQQRPPQRMGAEKQHLKLWMTDGHTTHEAVWWGAANEPLPAAPFDLAFAPQINDYNGRRTIQLKVLDWRPAQ